METNRRSLIKLAALAPVMAGSPLQAMASDAMQQPDEPLPGKADHVLRVSTGLAELAPDHIVSTTLYNDQFPGALLRMREGERVTVDVHNIRTLLPVPISPGGRTQGKPGLSTSNPETIRAVTTARSSLCLRSVRRPSARAETWRWTRLRARNCRR